jgi:hypothetical protein
VQPDRPIGSARRAIAVPRRRDLPAMNHAAIFGDGWKYRSGPSAKPPHLFRRHRRPLPLRAEQRQELPSFVPPHAHNAYERVIKDRPNRFLQPKVPISSPPREGLRKQDSFPPLQSREGGIEALAKPSHSLHPCLHDRQICKGD